MSRRALISQTGAGTQVVVAAGAGKSVRVSRIFLNLSAAGTIDFQDTGNASLVGAPMSVGANGQVYLTYATPEDAKTNPLFVTTAGLGFQIVNSAGNTTGFVDFDQQ